MSLRNRGSERLSVLSEPPGWSTANERRPGVLPWDLRTEAPDRAIANRGVIVPSRDVLDRGSLALRKIGGRRSVLCVVRRGTPNFNQAVRRSRQCSSRSRTAPDRDVIGGR